MFPFFRRDRPFVPPPGPYVPDQREEVNEVLRHRMISDKSLTDARSLTTAGGRPAADTSKAHSSFAGDANAFQTLRFVPSSAGDGTGQVVMEGPIRKLGGEPSFSVSFRLARDGLSEKGLDSLKKKFASASGHEIGGVGTDAAGTVQMAVSHLAGLGLLDEIEVKGARPSGESLLRGVTLAGLKNVTIKGATDLSQVDLSKADVTLDGQPTCFRGADLRGAKLTSKQQSFFLTRLIELEHLTDQFKHARFRGLDAGPAFANIIAFKKQLKYECSNMAFDARTTFSVDDPEENTRIFMMLVSQSWLGTPGMKPFPSQHSERAMAQLAGIPAIPAEHKWLGFLPTNKYFDNVDKIMDWQSAGAGGPRKLETKFRVPLRDGNELLVQTVKRGNERENVHIYFKDLGDSELRTKRATYAPDAAYELLAEAVRNGKGLSTNDKAGTRVYNAGWVRPCTDWLRGFSMIDGRF